MRLARHYFNPTQNGTERTPLQASVSVPPVIVTNAPPNSNAWRPQGAPPVSVEKPKWNPVLPNNEINGESLLTGCKLKSHPGASQCLPTCSLSPTHLPPRQRGRLLVTITQPERSKWHQSTHHRSGLQFLAPRYKKVSSSLSRFRHAIAEFCSLIQNLRDLRRPSSAIYPQAPHRGKHPCLAEQRLRCLPAPNLLHPKSLQCRRQLNPGRMFGRTPRHIRVTRILPSIW